MELLAEGGPYVIPDRRIDHSVMKQDNSFRPAATFLVVEPRPVDINKCSRGNCGARSLSGQKSNSKEGNKQKPYCASSHIYRLDSRRSEERRVRKECRSRWSPYH